MVNLQGYYDEHSTQARQHEGQREAMTNIILGVTGLLVGLVTFGDFSPWALPAALTVLALGVYGFFFSGKHYERFKFHTTIMKKIRAEMDRLEGTPDAKPRALADLRDEGEKDHYAEFVWPKLRGTASPRQAGATSWIARQRLHVFWEGIHLLIAVLGLALCVTIAAKKAWAPTASEPLKVHLVTEPGK